MKRTWRTYSLGQEEDWGRRCQVWSAMGPTGGNRGDSSSPCTLHPNQQLPLSASYWVLLVFHLIGILLKKCLEILNFLASSNLPRSHREVMEAEPASWVRSWSLACALILTDCYSALPLLPTHTHTWWRYISRSSDRGLRLRSGELSCRHRSGRWPAGILHM